MGEAGKRAATCGAGTIFKRGRIWYVFYYVDGQQFIRSTRSTCPYDAAYEFSSFACGSLGRALKELPGTGSSFVAARGIKGNTGATPVQTLGRTYDFANRRSRIG